MQISERDIDSIALLSMCTESVCTISAMAPKLENYSERIQENWEGQGPFRSHSSEKLFQHISAFLKGEPSINNIWFSLLPRWKRRVRTVQHTIFLSQASPQAANVTFSYFHSFPLSELCWRKLQITFQAWDVKQLNCLNLKALKMKCYKQDLVTFHILAVKHLLPKSG